MIQIANAIACCGAKIERARVAADDGEAPQVSSREAARDHAAQMPCGLDQNDMQAFFRR